MVIDGNNFEDLGYIKCEPVIETRYKYSGNSVQTGTRIHEVQGVFINFNVTIDFKDLASSDRYRLIELLADAKREYHSFTIPFGDHNGSYSFLGWVESISDSLNTMLGANTPLWGSLSFTIKSKEPYSKPYED